VAAALLGGVFLVSLPSDADPGECGPTTLDVLFPDLDADGQPTTTLPTATAPQQTVPTSDPDPSTTTTTQPGAPTPTTSAPGSSTTVGPEAPSTTTPPPAPPTTRPCPTWVYDMQFPLASEARFTSSFGADRDGGSRRHKGTDILAPKLTPVLAVADGVIGSVHASPPDDCCWLTIRHNDGWQSLYVHLNNDTHLSDDGLGYGVRPGLEAGTEVVAGQVIGWVGDSGNAEATVPHLHFELRHPGGYSVDAAPSLKAAARSVELAPYFGPYVDDEGLAIETLASRLVAAGAYWPCDNSDVALCPHQLAQPEDSSELVGLLTGLTPPLVETREQALSIAGMVPGRFIDGVTGCEIVRDCLQTGITAGDVARMVTWTRHIGQLVGETPLSDPLATVGLPDVASAERTLRFLGTVGICHESIDDVELITRGEMLELLNWWVLGESPTSCVQSAGPER
jgi:murein DD-endopeptidase MepM/ murein hydrolase activator NlpD